MLEGGVRCVDVAVGLMVTACARAEQVESDEMFAETVL
jgi:hypothetical protein